MSWLDWENLENIPPQLMKAVCSGHSCFRVPGRIQQQLDGLLKEQVSWMAPVLPCPVVPVRLWP